MFLFFFYVISYEIDFFLVEDHTSTKDKNISLYISVCKLHPMNRLYRIELDLKTLINTHFNRFFYYT